MFKEHIVRLYPAEMDLLRILVARQQSEASRARIMTRGDRKYEGQRLESVVAGLDILEHKLRAVDGSGSLTATFECFDRRGEGLPADGSGIDAVNAHSWVELAKGVRYDLLRTYRDERRRLVWKARMMRRQGARPRDIQREMASARLEHRTAATGRVA